MPAAPRRAWLRLAAVMLLCAAAVVSGRALAAPSSTAPPNFRRQLFAHGHAGARAGVGAHAPTGSHAVAPAPGAHDATDEHAAAATTPERAGDAHTDPSDPANTTGDTGEEEHDEHGAHAADAHGEHGAGDTHCGGGHGDGAHEEHGEHGGAHHGASQIDDEIALLLMLSLILLSVIFEKTKHHLEHSVDEHKHIILQALFGELTVLGFIALITFFLMDSGVFTHLSVRLYDGDEEHLLHLFEKVHFGLFFVMILFLLLIGWLIYVQNVAARRWHDLDKRGGEYLLEQRSKRREVEKARKAVEEAAMVEATADARRRIREANAAKKDGTRAHDDPTDDAAAAVRPPPLPPPSDDYLKARYGDGGAVPVGLGVRAGYTRQVDEGAALDMDDTSSDWQLRKRDPALYRFLQMRQRFVYGLQGAEGRKIKLNDPNDTFNFGAYLTQCSAGITAEIVEVHPVTWVLVAASLGLVYVANLFLGAFGMCLLLVLWGWLCALTLHAARRDLERIERALAPPYTASLLQIQLGEEDAQPEYALRPIGRRCNKHEALFPFGLQEEGPEWFCHIVRTILLTCAVYVIGLQSIFASEMLSVQEMPTALGATLLALALTSVVVTLALVLPTFPLLVATQSVGMMKKAKLVERTFRQQKLDLSLRLLKLLTSMQSHSRKLRKLKAKAAAGASVAPADVRTAEEAKAALDEQEHALAVLERNPTQKKELEAAFRLFDTSGDGNIEASELKALLHSMGQKVSDAEAQQLCSEMDADGSGSVSLVEFLAVMASEVDEEANEPLTVEKLTDDMFAILDKDASGIVSFKEFRAAMQSLPTGMTDEEIDEVLQEMFGGGGDTQIDKHEFIHFISAHKEELGL